MQEGEVQDRFSLRQGADSSGADEFAEDVRSGLTSIPKRLSCQFIYDAEGSRLFEQICRLPEYYPTRTEAAILAALAPGLANLMGAEAELVELGSGSAEKTKHLIESFLAAHGSLTYRPIDISVDAIRGSSMALLKQHRELRIDALAMEYRAGLAALKSESGAVRARLILWLGSSIGNFTRPAAMEFLSQVRAEMGPKDRMLVGFDMRKDKRVLEAAYDDSQGITAAFNKNVLKRINATFDGDFQLDDFRHEARYLEEEGRIEMWLISEKQATVCIGSLKMQVSFEAGEGIHTENSYKYSREEIQELALGAGFSIGNLWFDEQERFCDALLAPVKL